MRPTFAEVIEQILDFFFLGFMVSLITCDINPYNWHWGYRLFWVILWVWLTSVGMKSRREQYEKELQNAQTTKQA